MFHNKKYQIAELSSRDLKGFEGPPQEFEGYF